MHLRRWLRDYVHVRVNQWPVGSPCLLFGQFVKNETVSDWQFSSVQLRRFVRDLTHRLGLKILCFRLQFNDKMLEWGNILIILLNFLFYDNLCDITRAQKQASTLNDVASP